MLLKKIWFTDLLVLKNPLQNLCLCALKNALESTSSEIHPCLIERFKKIFLKNQHRDTESS